MNPPKGQLEVMPQRGSSQRKTCRYLGLSIRISTYTLKQSAKDRSSMGERLVATSQEPPYRGLVVAGEIVLTPSLGTAQAEHSKAAATSTALRQRYLPAGRHTELRLCEPTNWSRDGF